MKTKKGFTLIELLAIIVILAIVALIATPIVLNIIKDSNQSAVLVSAGNYLGIIDTSLINYEINNNEKFLDGFYKISEDSTKLVNLDNEDLVLNVAYNGNRFSGIIYIEDSKVSNVFSFYCEDNIQVFMTSDNKLTLDSSKEKPLPEYIQSNKLIIIDYDGTILVEKNMIYGQDYKLPTPPNHSELVFQEWVSPVEIIDNKITMKDYDIVIGPIFTTKSDKNEFDIKLTEDTGLSFSFQNITNVSLIDWGDGTVNTELSHEYKKYGNYKIKINKDIIIGSEPFTIKDSVINIRLATGVKFQNKHYIFSKLKNLETISLPQGLSYSYAHFLDAPNKLKGLVIPYSFNQTFMDNSSTIEYVALGRGLSSINGYTKYSGAKTITIPDTVTTIGLYSFYGNSKIEKLVIPASVSNIQNRAFGSMTNLKKVVFKGSIAKIPNQLFDNCPNALIYDLSNFDSIPTLENINAFNNINKDAKILVPKKLYNEWVLAENWSDPKIVNHIVSTEE